eukprot:SAG11_NODE_2409_length_3396_cov_1.523506_1_plen_97_part_10
MGLLQHTAAAWVDIEISKRGRAPEKGGGVDGSAWTSSYDRHNERTKGGRNIGAEERHRERRLARQPSDLVEQAEREEQLEGIRTRTVSPPTTATSPL